MKARTMALALMLALSATFAEAGISRAPSGQTKKIAKRGAGTAAATTAPAVQAAAQAPAALAESAAKQAPTTTSATAKPANPYAYINEDNCEFHYNLCMNNSCSDKKIGKCVCYEDNEFNAKTAPSFADVNGMKVRKGFDLFAAAQKSCKYVVDNCMENRRLITEKYRAMVQRDCLKLSEIETMKDRSLWGELQELKECVRDYCTASSMGAENFEFPELGLCFNDDYADYVIDSQCSKMISNTKTPLALRQLFHNNMALMREISCKRMNGEFSNDRKDCLITIEYGMGKDKIAASRKFAVGAIFTCDGATFNTSFGKTAQQKKDEKHRAILLAASGVRLATSVAGIAIGGGGFLGKAIGAGLDLAAGGVDIYITSEQVKKGEITEAEGVQMITSTSMNMALSAVSVAVNARGAASAAGAAAGAATEAATTLSTAAQTVQTAQNVATGLQVAGAVAQFGISAADEIIEQDIVKKQIEEEALGITKQTNFEDREAGIGNINQSAANHGSCFINKEWFATENEVLLLQWTL